MPQTNQVPALDANSTIPTYDSAYPAGDRGAGGGSGTLIARADWSSHGLTPTSILAGASWSIYGAYCSQIDDYLRISYPNTTSGGVSAGAAIQFSGDVDIADVYIEFQARMAGTKVGSKFCKVHGVNATGYANTTYGCSSGSGNLGYLGFGDGTTTENDVANVLFPDGSNPSWIGRSYGNGAVVNLKDPPSSFAFDTNWHTFKIHHKFNTGTTLGTETNDGSMYLEIDGVMYVDATGLFNRNYQNTRRISQITFGDWVQNDLAGNLDFRSIKISTGGFV